MSRFCPNPSGCRMELLCWINKKVLFYVLVNSCYAFLSNPTNRQHLTTQSDLSSHGEMFPWRYSEKKGSKSCHDGHSCRRAIFFGCSFGKVDVQWYVFKVFCFLYGCQLLVETACDAYRIEMAFYPGKCNINTFLHHISQLPCYLDFLLAALILDSLDCEDLSSERGPGKSVNNSDSIP